MSNQKSDRQQQLKKAKATPFSDLLVHSETYHAMLL